MSSFSVDVTDKKNVKLKQRAASSTYYVLMEKAAALPEGKCLVVKPGKQGQKKLHAALYLSARRYAKRTGVVLKVVRTDDGNVALAR